MALTATLYKASLQISDMDRDYYATRNLTLARHPSEIDQRLMARLLAFALNANEALRFGRGVSNADEKAGDTGTISSQQITVLAQCAMQLNCTIEDGDIWLGDDHNNIKLSLSQIKPS